MQQLSGGGFVTLRKVWTDYKQSRKLKPATERDYITKINRCFGDWMDLPVQSITKDMIEDRHRAISKSNGPRGNGEALANLSMRVLKALFNYASHKYEHLDGMPNPVRRLSEVRAWNVVKRRQSYIRPSQMPAWFQAVLTERSLTMRHYLLLLLFTGMRRSEAATLRWSDVDFIEEVLVIRSTKNGDDHALPLTDFVLRLLKIRQTLTKNEPYVFPGRMKGTHLSVTSKDHHRVVRDSGIKFMLHDLRRSFATTADLIGFDYSMIKRLLNHRIQDVTAGYIISSAHRLREPMQAITDELLKQAGVSKDCLG